MGVINRALFKRVLKENLTLKYLVIYLIIVSLPSLFFISLSEEIRMLAGAGLELKSEYMSGMFLIFSFFWICGVAISVLSAAICSSVVAEESSSRTLLLLVSKPVKRTSIIISKFLAFTVVITVFSLSSLLLSVHLWISLLNLDLLSLIKFLGFLPLLMIYSLLVALIFGSIATAFSVLFSSKLKTVLVTTAIIMLTFFAFLPVRETLISANVYSNHVISVFDLGYDFGNIYVTLLEKGNVKLIPPLQTAIGAVTGIYRIPPEGMKIDYDQEFILPSLEKTHYRAFSHSVAKLVLLASALLILSLLIFERKDVH